MDKTLFNRVLARTVRRVGLEQGERRDAVARAAKAMNRARRALSAGEDAVAWIYVAEARAHVRLARAM